MFNPQKTVCRIILIIFFPATLICLNIQAQQFRDVPPVLRECWFSPNNQIEEINGASDNEEGLYIPLLNGKLIAINSDTLEKSWETELAGVFTTDILVSQDSVYAVARRPDGESGEADDDSPPAVLYSLNRTTGVTQWQKKITSSDKAYLFDSDESLVFVGSDGDVYSIAKTDGATIWRKSLRSRVSSPPFTSKGSIIIGAFDKQISTLASKNGQLIEKLEAAAPPTVIVEDTTGNNLIIGDKRGFLQSLNKKRKTRNWTYRQGAEISFVTVTNQGLLISSLDNFLYLLSESSGKLLWKRRLAGRITAKPQVRGSFFIITSIDDPVALLVELSSGKVINKITLEDNNFFTGSAMQAKNLFIYTTRRGIFAFSVNEDDCALRKNRL